MGGLYWEGEESYWEWEGHTGSGGGILGVGRSHTGNGGFILGVGRCHTGVVGGHTGMGGAILVPPPHPGPSDPSPSPPDATSPFQYGEWERGAGPAPRRGGTRRSPRR